MHQLLNPLKVMFAFDKIQMIGPQPCHPKVTLRRGVSFPSKKEFSSKFSWQKLKIGESASPPPQISRLHFLSAHWRLRGSFLIHASLPSMF